MSKLVPVFSAPADMVSNLSNLRGLPINSAVGIGVFDLVTVRASDVFISLDLDAAGGVGHVGLYILPVLDSAAQCIPGYTLSQVGANLRFGVDTANLSNLQELLLIPNSVSYTEVWVGSIANLYGNLPPYFCLAIANYSNAVWGSGAFSIKARYVSYEYV